MIGTNGDRYKSWVTENRTRWDICLNVNWCFMGKERSAKLNHRKLFQIHVEEIIRCWWEEMSFVALISIFFFLALCQSCNFRTIKEGDEGFAFRPKSCYIAMMCHFLIVSLGAGLKFVTSFLPVHGQVGDPEQWSLVVPSIQAVMGIRAASQTRLVTPCGGFPWWGAGQHYPSWRLLLAGRAYMRLSAAIAPASLMCCWAALCAAVLWSSPLWHLNCD